MPRRPVQLDPGVVLALQQIHSEAAIDLQRLPAGALAEFKVWHGTRLVYTFLGRRRV